MLCAVSQRSYALRADFFPCDRWRPFEGRSPQLSRRPAAFRRTVARSAASRFGILATLHTVLELCIRAGCGPLPPLRPSVVARRRLVCYTKAEPSRCERRSNCGEWGNPLSRVVRWFGFILHDAARRGPARDEDQAREACTVRSNCGFEQRRKSRES